MSKLVTRGLLAVVVLLALIAPRSASGAYARSYEGKHEAAVMLLGGQKVAGHKNYLHEDRAEAFRMRAHTSGVTAVVRIYVDRGTTARAVAVGIYSDAGGRPGSLLSEGSGASLRAHAWSAVSITPTPLISGRIYWLALLGKGGTLHYRTRRREPCLSSLSVRAHLRKLPKLWRTGGVRARTHCPISAYAAATDLAPTAHPPVPASTASPFQPAPPAVSTSPLGEPAPPAPPTEEPSPASPAPTDTVQPSISGSAVVGELLHASSGTWTGSPTAYSYQWEDCDALAQGCLNAGGATASSYRLSASDLGSTVRVVVTANNAGGSTPASSAATAAVEEPPPPPPPAPANTVAPTISGSAVEGETLQASPGTWSGNPTSYTYQWRDCNVSGQSCSNIPAATTSTRVLTSSEVNYTLRVLVKATNAHGTGEASSNPTAVVAAKQKSGTPENCFPNPEGCGYPGPNNVGVQDCSALPKTSGAKTITKSETVENTNITGSVTVDASGVTLNHDCVVFNGSEAEGSAAVVLEGAASNFTISNTTVRGENTTSGSFEEAIRNNHSDPGATATKDRLEDCSECIHQSWTLEESYVIANGREQADENGTAHTEDWWFDNNTITANDDTLLNPAKQTAVIFAESGGGECENHEKVTNSLLAGGGLVFYFCAHSTGAGSSSIEINNDRFARQKCTIKEIEDYEGRGGFGCQPEGGYFEDGEGSGGYFPRGGFFGLVYEGEGLYNNDAGWVGNFWDDNLEAQLEEAY